MYHKPNSNRNDNNGRNAFFENSIQATRLHVREVEVMCDWLGCRRASEAQGLRAQGLGGGGALTPAQSHLSNTAWFL